MSIKYQDEENEDVYCGPIRGKNCHFANKINDVSGYTIIDKLENMCNNPHLIREVMFSIVLERNGWYDRKKNQII